MAATTTSPKSDLPARPDIVVRIGFAGARPRTSDERSAKSDENRTAQKGATDYALRQALVGVYGTIGKALREVASARDEVNPETRKVAHFYSSKLPLVRLVSGLAEGADTLAAEALRTFGDANASALRVELAGVLAFSHDAYKTGRDRLSEDHPQYAPLPNETPEQTKSRRMLLAQKIFEDLYQSCAYVVELDAVYGTSDPRRHRGYRAQTTVLLRHADVFVGMTDFSDTGKAGGTQEAVRAALAFGLPVVLIDTATASIRVIDAKDDVDDVLSRGEAPKAADAHEQLRRTVLTILADPDVNQQDAADGGHVSRRRAAAKRLLSEYFELDDMPPMTVDKKDRRVRRKTRRERLWTAFENRFATKKVAPDEKKPKTPSYEIPVYKTFRQRASDLSAHYAGLYRGAFILNYALAVVAVGVAALSFVVLGGGLARLVASVARLWPPERGAEAVVVARTVVLLVLACVKLGVLVAILINTRQANEGFSNERAVDYRYLAERIRALFFLPFAASFQPEPAAPGYSSRVVRQSAADWLFEAIVRHVSPAVMADSRPGRKPGPPVICPEPVSAIERLRSGWLDGQLNYHGNNRIKMHAMFKWLDRFGRALNWTVIVAVVVDLAVLIGELADIGPAGFHHAAPWLLFLAAVLPAAAASVNGIRFQSECQRLAERSEVMSDVIRGRRHQAERLMARILEAKRNDATDPHSWTPSVLRLTESIAADMANEAAEWSVLYAKEILDQ